MKNPNGSNNLKIEVNPNDALKTRSEETDKLLGTLSKNRFSIKSVEILFVARRVLECIMRKCKLENGRNVNVVHEGSVISLLNMNRKNAKKVKKILKNMYSLNIWDDLDCNPPTIEWWSNNEKKCQYY